MSRIYFQALNEIANFGDWSSHIESGDSTLEQVEDASFPYRGKYGLRLHCVNNYEYAYVSKADLNISVPPGGSVFICFAHRFANNPSSTAWVVVCRNSNNDSVFAHQVLSSGKIRHSYKDDATNWHNVDGTKVLTGDWHWLCIELRRATSSTASDGIGRLYVDGVLDIEETGIDNYDILAVLDKLQVGGIGYTSPGFVIDFDEVVVADRLIEPPLPAGKVWR